MKRLTSLFGLAAIIAIAGLASADEQVATKPAKTEAVKNLLEKLPQGKIILPKTASTSPKSIPASEKVDGFYLEVPPHMKEMKGSESPRYAMVYASKEDAAARNSGTRTGEPSSCFMNSYPSGASEVQWAGSLNTSTSVQNYPKTYGYNYGSVQMVRSERIVKDTGDKITYDVTLAYVDAETMGVRQVSKQTVEFSLVREMPGKVKVYGAKSDDQLTFLVRRERHDKERFFFGPLMVTVNGQHSASSSDGCPVMFSLKATKGVAANAVVQLEAMLEVQDIAPDAGESGITGRLGVMPVGDGQREARMRPMRIGVSSTWMSQDTAPVLSVSHGWAGRERTQPI